MALADKARLINAVLLPGTPRAISSHAQYCELLRYISDKMGIHPNNLFFKGSTKIGFSIAPKAEKVWMEYGPASDLDLAIVDSGFYTAGGLRGRKMGMEPGEPGKDVSEPAATG
jgi:hypothetical protein